MCGNSYVLKIECIQSDCVPSRRLTVEEVVSQSMQICVEHVRERERKIYAALHTQRVVTENMLERIKKSRFLPCEVFWGLDNYANDSVSNDSISNDSVTNNNRIAAIEHETRIFYYGNKQTNRQQRLMIYISNHQ